MSSTSRRSPARRASAAIAALAALAIVGASCTTPGGGGLPPQPSSNIEIEAQTLHVIDDNNDGLGLFIADEPYIINLAFRVKFGTPGSASTFLVHDVSNELTCPGTPPGFPWPADSCATGESTSVPNAMGEVQFPALQWVDVFDILVGRQPELAGTFAFAYEEDQIFGSGSVATTIAAFAAGVETILNSTVATGSLPADENAAAALIVSIIGDVALGFIGGTLLGLLSGLGNADDLIGVAPIIVVGIGGGMSTLAIAAGLTSTTVLNGKIFTAAGGGATTVHTEQSLGGFDIGDSGTQYDVDWLVQGF